MLDDHRLAIGPELSGEYDVASRYSVDGSTRRGCYADAVPAQSRVVRSHHPAEVVKYVAIHRPVELAVVGRPDRARSAGNRARLAAPAAALRFNRGDDVVELRFTALYLRQALLRLARVLLYLHETLLPLALQRLKPRLFLCLFESVLLHVALQRHKLAPAAANRRAQIVHSPDEGAIVQCDLVKILVARNELTERIGRKQRLKIE